MTGNNVMNSANALQKWVQTDVVFSKNQCSKLSCLSLPASSQHLSISPSSSGHKQYKKAQAAVNQNSTRMSGNAGEAFQAAIQLTQDYKTPTITWLVIKSELQPAQQKPCAIKLSTW